MTLKQQLKGKIDILQLEQFSDEHEYRFFEFLSQQILESKDLSGICNNDYLLALITLEGKESFDVISESFAEIGHCLNDKRPDISEDIIYLLTTIHGLKKINLLDSVLELDHEPNGEEFDKIIKKYDPKRDGVIHGKKGPKLEVVACAVGYKSIGLGIFDDFDQLQTFTKHVSKCKDIDQKFTKFIRNEHLLDISLQ